jgi:hypothetical protein
MNQKWLDNLIMKRVVYVLLLLLFFVFSTAVFSADFKPYPGAKIDEKATKEARQETGMATTIYTTGDSFDKVYAFYKNIAKEYKMPPSEGTFNLRSGGVLKEAYFIFDGAGDILSSKSWIKIQRPYMGRMKAKFPPNPKYVEDIYEDIRDVTVIIK